MDKPLPPPRMPRVVTVEEREVILKQRRLQGGMTDQEEIAPIVPHGPTPKYDPPKLINDERIPF